MPDERRILLAEDSRMLRAAIAKHLEREGYAVAIAADGAEALEIYRSDPFPVALLDYEMPRLNGLELLAQIKAIDASTEVVLMTSVGSEEVAAQALNGGASSYITKTSREDMLAILGRYLDEAFRKRALLEQNRRLLAEMRSHNERLERMVAERTEELERAYKELEGLDRMKFDLITLISHQIRTPLASIMGYSELILQGCFEGDADGLMGAVGDIHSQGIRLSRFVDDAASFLSWRSGHVDIVPCSFEIVAVVREIVEAQDERIQAKGLEPIFEGAREARVESDINHFTEVVRRVLMNAIEYSEPGGRIWIRVEDARDPEGGGRAGVRTEIRDEGKGIAPDAMQGLFRPLEVCRDLRHHSDGNGMGLALCWEALQALHGAISVESEGVGTGCRVAIWLPKAWEPRGAEPTPCDPAVQAGRSGTLVG